MMGVEDPEESDRRIEAAPREIRELFHDYETHLVLQALTMAGINGPPETFTAQQITEGSGLARAFLVAEMRRREKERMGG